MRQSRYASLKDLDSLIQTARHASFVLPRLTGEVPEGRRGCFSPPVRCLKLCPPPSRCASHLPRFAGRGKQNSNALRAVGCSPHLDCTILRLAAQALALTERWCSPRGLHPTILRLSPTPPRRLGSVLVTFMFTQNLVSIVRMSE
jgi:hypothetical protein